MPSIEEIQRFHVDQIKTLPAKFLDLEFVPESFAVFYGKQLEANSTEFKPIDLSISNCTSADSQ
jgi:hypothetical protein